MADKFNLVSAELSPEVQAQVLALFAQAAAALPFLIALSKDTRKGLAWPGVEGLEASVAIAEVIATHPELFPPAVVNPVEIKRDATLAKALLPIRDAVAGLLQGIEDTIAGAGSDSLRGALKGYAMAQVLKNMAPGLEARIQPMATHLDRPARG